MGRTGRSRSARIRPHPANAEFEYRRDDAGSDQAEVAEPVDNDGTRPHIVFSETPCLESGQDDKGILGAHFFKLLGKRVEAPCAISLRIDPGAVIKARRADDSGSQDSRFRASRGAIHNAPARSKWTSCHRRAAAVTHRVEKMEIRPPARRKSSRSAGSRRSIRPRRTSEKDLQHARGNYNGKQYDQAKRRQKRFQPMNGSTLVCLERTVSGLKLREGHSFALRAGKGRLRTHEGEKPPCAQQRLAFLLCRFCFRRGA